MTNLVSYINKAAEEIRININEVQLKLFQQYFELLIEGNNKVNLTALTEPVDVAIKHFIDSLTCLQVYSIPEGARVLDIGTGAGFPGIPLKIYRPDLEITLMDSLNKRVNFLNETITSLGLQGINAIHDRAEDFGQRLEYRECFDVVVSRAVARLAVLSEYCLPCVKVNGYFISQKGPDIEDEVNEASRAISTLGGNLVEIKNLSLPIIGDGRSLIIIKKIKTTPKQYPRKAGTPAKKPIL